ncbi:MAG TPA: hypothetical protein VGH65_03425 [Verrucomicrobiaceae bacterium]|jgi:hypothetical protein
MQVSWIDPDEIAKLAAQLDGPLQREEVSSWDLETLPDVSKLLAAEEAPTANPATLADAMAAPPPEAMEQQGASPPPEVAHIREKLRSIRDRAQDAGLLPPRQSPAIAPKDPDSNIATDVTISPATAFDESARERSAVPLPAPPFSAPGDAAQIQLDTPVPSIPAPAGPEFPADSSITERLRIFMRWAQSQVPCEDILLVDDHGDLLWGGSTRADLALSVVLTAGAGLRSGSDALTRSSVFIRSRLGEQKELSVLPCPTRHGMVTLALLNANTLANDTAAGLRDALARCIDDCAV